MRRIMKLTAIVAALSLGATAAQAQSQISGAINADNQFAVVVNYGNSPAATPVDTSSTGYRWGTTKRFNFTVRDALINQCHIDVITWGDGGVREGMAGVLKGNAGMAYTGGSGFTALETNITRNFASLSNSTKSSIANMAVVPPPTTITPVAGGSWGTINYNGSDFFGGSVPSDFSWVKPQGAGTTSKKYYVFRVPCNRLVKQVPVKMGMTFGIRDPYPNQVNGTIHVGCGDKDGVNCDAIKGDTLCTTPKPILCINPLKLPKPANTVESGRWDKWSGGIIGTTKPMPAPATLAAANQACTSEFGSGWRVAQFHDGYAGRSGWVFSAYGNVGTYDKRFWTDIDDQPNGVCWTR